LRDACARGSNLPRSATGGLIEKHTTVTAEGFLPSLRTSTTPRSASSNSEGYQLMHDHTLITLIVTSAFSLCVPNPSAKALTTNPSAKALTTNPSAYYKPKRLLQTQALTTN